MREVDPDWNKNSFEFHASELDTDSEDETINIGNLQTSLKREEEEYRKTLQNQYDLSSQGSDSHEDNFLLDDSISSVSQDDDQ